jgi:hypothetical protein
MNKMIKIMMQNITKDRLIPTLDRCKSIEMSRPCKAIKYNPALDENDYLEWLAKKNGQLVHITKDEYKKEINDEGVVKYGKTK